MAFTVASLTEFINVHVNNTNITASLSTVFSTTDPSIVIDFLKQKFGPRLFEKSGTGWRCFFCNKEFRNNFARHALRHTMKGDKINETLKELILEGGPLPPPTWSEYMSKKKLQRELEQNEGYWSTTNKLQTSYQPPTRSAMNQLRNNEIPPQQILFLVTQRIPSYLLQSPIISLFLQEAEKTSNVTSTIINNQYPAFLHTIRQLGEKILTERGSLSYEFEDLKRIFKYIEEAYREEMGKRSVLSSIEANKLLSTCAVCSNGSSTAHGSLFPCIGHCFRAFHSSCVSSSTFSVIYSQNTGKRIVYCEDCKNGKKVLRWDANKKQYYYFHIEADHSLKNYLPNGEIVPGGMDSDEPLRLSKGVGRELTLLFDHSSLRDTNNISLNDSNTLQIAEVNDVALKQKLRAEEGNNRNDMWYDPYLCIWRCKTKESLGRRNERQSRLIAEEKEKNIMNGDNNQQLTELQLEAAKDSDSAENDIDVSHFFNDDDDEENNNHTENNGSNNEDETDEAGNKKNKKRSKKRKSLKSKKKRKIHHSDDESSRSSS